MPFAVSTIPRARREALTALRSRGISFWWLAMNCSLALSAAPAGRTTGAGALSFGRDGRVTAVVDGTHVAVTNRVANTISIIDENTLTNVGDITGLLPGPDDMELSADKKTLWVTFRFAKKVGIIDLASRKLVQTIAVGRSPHGIFVQPRATRAASW